MIKINLLKNRLDAQLDQEFGAVDSGSGDGKVIIARNLVVMFSLMAALITYEKININALEKVRQQVSAQENALANEVAEKEEQVAALGELEVESRGMKERHDALKELGQLRLREIKFLDFLQAIIPDRVWFKQLQYDKGRLVIDGLTLQDEDLNQFLRKLQSSSIFSEVILRKSSKIKETGKDLLSFEVMCSLEKAK